MALIRSRSAILAKQEVTYDTDPTPTGGANAVAVENLQQSWPHEVVERNIIQPAIGKLRHLHGRKMGQLTFDVPLKGSGTAGTPPDLGVLLEACGFAVTNVPVTSDTYDPVSTGFNSCTIYVYRDGLLWKYTGCRGNVAFNFPIGQQPMATFTFMGHVLDPTDTAVPSITIDTTAPEVCKGATFTMGGTASIVSNISIDMQNQLTFTDDLTDESGYGEVVIADRNPVGSFDPEMELVATKDFWSIWEDSTLQALSIVLGATAGNILTLTADQCYHRELSEADRSGVLVYEIPFSLAHSAGDDEIAIAFT